MLLNQNIIYSRGFSGVNTYDRVLANARFLDGEDNLRGQCFMCKRRIEQESITIEVILHRRFSTLLYYSLNLRFGKIMTGEKFALMPRNKY